MLKLPISSGGTEPRSAADVIGSRTFFAPLSRHTCSEFASSSALMSEPLMLISPRTASEGRAGFKKLYSLTNVEFTCRIVVKNIVRFFKSAVLTE